MKRRSMCHCVGVRVRGGGEWESEWVSEWIGGGQSVPLLYKRRGVFLSLKSFKYLIYPPPFSFPLLLPFDLQPCPQQTSPHVTHPLSGPAGHLLTPGFAAAQDWSLSNIFKQDLSLIAGCSTLGDDGKTQLLSSASALSFQEMDEFGFLWFDLRKDCLFVRPRRILQESTWLYLVKTKSVWNIQVLWSGARQFSFDIIKEHLALFSLRLTVFWFYTLCNKK